MILSGSAGHAGEHRHEVSSADPRPLRRANNSATDTDTVTGSADLAITKTDGVASVIAGTSTTYTITVTNNGPSHRARRGD